MEIPVRVDWKILTAEGIECQHIRLHQLQQSDDLNELAAKYKKSLAVAMILVNTQDSYELAEQLYHGIVRAKKPILPAVVITMEDGKKIKEYLSRHDPGEVHARFESKKQAHIEPSGMAKESTPSPATQLKFKRHGKCTVYMYYIGAYRIHTYVCNKLVRPARPIPPLIHKMYLLFWGVLK